MRLEFEVVGKLLMMKFLGVEATIPIYWAVTLGIALLGLFVSSVAVETNKWRRKK